MRQPINFNEPATKNDLYELEKNLEDKFATKKDLTTEISALDTSVDIKLDNLERNIDDKAQKYPDQILTGLDAVMKELELAREDRELGLDQFKKLEKRVGRLEDIQHITHD